MKKKVLSIALAGLLLGGCGKSAEDAYERGVWDGTMEVCWEARRISDHVYQQLRSESHC